MSYSSFDMREAIREQIGTSKYLNGNDEYVISIEDDYHDTIDIPLLLPGEARGDENREMPFIEMVMVTAPVEVHNVQGDVRRQEGYIDFNIYYTNTDNITPSKFGKTIADELVDKIMQNRHSVTGTYWMEVINDCRELIEEAVSGKSVIFHRVVEIYCNNYTKG